MNTGSGNRNLSGVPEQGAARRSAEEQCPQGDGMGEDATQSQPRPPISPQRQIASLFIQILLPPVWIAAGLLLGFFLIAQTQSRGWLGAGFNETSAADDTEDPDVNAVSYICPMMCVPPTQKPGRCPVCAMELVPAAATQSGPATEIQIDPRARRVAGIQTVAAEMRPLEKSITGVGTIDYNESEMKTIAAYVDGRIESLAAGFTGIQVQTGEALATLYSPELYSAQVEYIRTIRPEGATSDALSGLGDVNVRLRASARQRLVELGMTESQIETLEKDRLPSRRLTIYAPISGTVIEKLVSTGEYVSPGTPLLRMADLSTVWMVVELFPEDATLIRTGQFVETSLRGTDGRNLYGVVEFVEPVVDRSKRTVGVRVLMENASGQLRPGALAKATIKAPLTLGEEIQEVVAIPRNSLLSVGATSLVYVETKPGHYQLRRVNTGPTVDGWVAVLDGISEGEQVVARSAFLLDAQMQLQGNPSLIDPNKAILTDDASDDEAAEIASAFAPLSDADLALARSQVICPVTKVKLGTLGMGTPIRVEVGDRAVMICCEGCRKALLAEPDRFLQVLESLKSEKGASSEIEEDGEAAEIAAAFAPLSDADLALARSQVICPVTKVKLGTLGMGTPIRVEVGDRAVMICCEGCRKALLAEPDRFLQVLFPSPGETH